MRITPDGEIATVVLQPGDVCQCESDAVVTASSNTEIEGSMSGGILGAIGRKFLTGESFFMQHLRSTNDHSAEVVIAPKCPGDVRVLEVIPTAGVIFANGAFLAASKQASVTSQFQGNVVHSTFSGTGLFTVKVTGQGPVAFSGFGRVFEKRLGSTEFLMVDNGHVVGWTADASYTMEMASKTIMSSFTSGEGLMCRFRGPGTIYIQSRNPKSFQEWLSTYISSERGGGTQVSPICGIIIFMVFCFIFVGAFALMAYYGVEFDNVNDYDKGHGRVHYQQSRNSRNNRDNW